MAEFTQAFEKMILNEGGYKLTDTPGDRGGQTYAGIARNAWPKWAGWKAIDDGETPESALVRAFYQSNFWFAIHGDKISDQAIAETVFDFAVNAGVKTAAMLAQTVVGATPDGKIGPVTLAAVNAQTSEKFVMAYALAKIARYAAIVRRDRSQQKFLLGWVNRALEGIV